MSTVPLYRDIAFVVLPRSASLVVGDVTGIDHQPASLSRLDSGQTQPAMSVGTYFLTLLTALLASVPALHTLSYATQSPKPSFFARLIASYLSITACAIYGVISSITLRLVGRGGLCQWTAARSFKWTMWVMTGVTFEVEDNVGGLDVRPAVFVGNHQT